MRRPAPPALWAIIGAGVGIRAIVAATTSGLAYDVHSFELVRAALSARPLHLYSIVNPGDSFHWPYPPGFLPFVLASAGLSDVFGGGFTHLIRAPAILADAALAWVVWRGLAERASERRRLIAAALVALGPVFVTISAYATQIDSVAILPAAIALLVWERGGDRRGLTAGLLIGVAASIKTVPGLMVLALAPSARSWREVLTLCLTALGVLALTLVPFLAPDASAVLDLRHYTGVPGVGGLSLVLQPDLAQNWLTHVVPASALTAWLFVKHATLLNVAAVLAFIAYGAARRPEPRNAAVVLWLVILAFGSGFFFQYLIWLLPFLLLADELGSTAALQAAITIPMLLFYLGPWHASAIVYVYVAVMLLAWVSWVAGAGLLARRSGTARAGPAT